MFDVNCCSYCFSAFDVDYVGIQNVLEVTHFEGKLF